MSWKNQDLSWKFWLKPLYELCPSSDKGLGNTITEKLDLKLFLGFCWVLSSPVSSFLFASTDGPQASITDSACCFYYPADPGFKFILCRQLCPHSPPRAHHVTHLYHCSERPSITTKLNLVIFRYGPENNVENNDAFKILSRKTKIWMFLD